MATIKETKVKEAMKNAQIREVLEKYSPGITRNPAVKLMGRKSCGKIIELVVSKGYITKETAEKIEEEINALL